MSISATTSSTCLASNSYLTLDFPKSFNPIQDVGGISGQMLIKGFDNLFHRNARDTKFRSHDHIYNII